jgi:hypothetical protein
VQLLESLTRLLTSDGLFSYMFLTYPSAELATHALRCLDQVLFGKNRLYVNRFGEIERYASMNIEEGSTPKNWPADSQAVDKVSEAPPRSRDVSANDEFRL